MAAVLVIGLLSTVAMLTLVVRVSIGPDGADGTAAQPWKTTIFTPRPPTTTTTTTSHHHPSWHKSTTHNNTAPNPATATRFTATTNTPIGTITTKTTVQEDTSTKSTTTRSEPRTSDVILTSATTLMTHRPTQNVSSLTTVTTTADTGMRFDPMTATPRLQFTTKLRVSSDKEDAFCTAVVALSNRRFVINDIKNRRVKMISMSEDGKRERTRYIGLQADPWDLAMLPDGLVAVATDETHWIYILNVTNSLTIQKRLRTKHTYLGIAPGVEEGTLLVSSRDGSIHVISRSDGQVLKRHSLPVSFRPSYLCLAGDELIISDWAMSKLFRLNVVTGEYLGKLKHNMLETPHQVTADKAGNLYVAGYGSGNVMIRSPQGDWRQLLKSKKQVPGVGVTDDGIVVLWSDLTISADYDVRMWTIAKGYRLT